MSALFEPVLFVFTIPLLVALVLGGMALLGLFDVEALDADLDADAGADASGDGVLQFLGLGMVPLSVVLVIFCFSFGWIGLLLVSLLGGAMASWIGGSFVVSLVLAAPAFVGGLFTTAPLARLLSPLFQDHGQAQGARELIGKPATLTTGSVTSSFGSAAIRVPGRGRVEVAARATDEDGEHLGYGDRVLIYDYDPRQRVYFVAPYREAEKNLN